MRRPRNKPSLEILESRVLLSTIDTPTDANSGNWQTAIYSGGADLSIEVSQDSQVLKIIGTGHGNLTVDLSQLPASIVNLQIGSFDSVALTGEHNVASLALSNIQNVDAGRITIGSTLWANNVEHIKIDHAPSYIWLQGATSDDQITVGDKTLLEVEHFSPDANATIFAFVKNLGLATPAAGENLPSIIGVGVDSIMLNFTPAHSLVGSGVPAQASVIKGVDFTRYFLSTPAERTALEQSLLITSQAALIERVSLATLLNGDPHRQIALGESMDFNTTRLAVRPPTEKVFDTTRLDPSLNRNSLLSADTPVESSHADTAFEVGLLSASETSHEGVTRAATVGENHAVETTPRPLDIANFDVHSDASRASDSTLVALSVSLSHLAEPFVQTLSNMKGRLATFGELATAQVTDHLRTDGRPALLADTRGPKQQREEQDVLVVHI